MGIRTIKFRGKYLHGDEHWIYGSLQQPKDGCMLIFPPEAPDSYDKYLINPETVGQFTGLHDKNGNEIYEGDILGKKDTPVRYIIEWDCISVSFRLRSLMPFQLMDLMTAIGILGYEVIGNVHDNIALLKK